MPQRQKQGRLRSYQRRSTANQTTSSYRPGQAQSGPGPAGSTYPSGRTWERSSKSGRSHAHGPHNASLRPEEAIALGSRILIEHLNILTELSEIADTTGVMNAKQEDSKLKKLETSIDDLDFSVRAYNCLKRAGVNTIGDLTAKSEVEMMKIRNLGKKSLKEVIDKIKDMGLRFREDD